MNSEPGVDAVDLQSDPRIAAMRQWDTTACGELERDKTRIEYFERVALDRHRQQPWQNAYVGFDRFAGKDVLKIGIGQGTDLVTLTARKPA